jgi:pre-mRNA 3'-end-processing factor FIP1
LIGLPIPKIDSSAVVTVVAKPGLDIEAIGQHEGVDIIDVDLESFQDKPWRKPGADLTDYFNFGFNENTWRAYCNKQKMFREE